MKKIIFLAVAIVFSVSGTLLFSQSVAINNDDSPANASSMLDIKSTSKGLLIPRMATSQRTAISSPASGLVVYDTDTKSFWFYSGSAWVEISTGGKGWLITGNSNTDTSSHFIGTTDNVPLIFKIKNSRSGIIDSASGNMALGFKTLYNNNYSTGKFNTAFGYKTLTSNSGGSENTAIGYNALLNNTNGRFNTAIGYKSMSTNTASYNTSIGSTSLFSNTTGELNTAIGTDALYYNYTGDSNTAVGGSALLYNTSGDFNTALGVGALYNNYSGGNNTAAGMNALYTNLSGIDNTAVGAGALYYNTSSQNTAMGYQALYLNSSGIYNTGIGSGSLLNNTTGYNNTAIGYSALNASTTGIGNTASGYEALVANTTGSRNTAGGYYALYGNTTGNYNTALGYNASNVESGLNNNTMVGAYSHIQNANGCTAIGYNASTMNTDNLIVLGSPPIAFTGGYTNWTNFSDGRFKKHVNEEVKGLDFIMRLRPVTYHMDIRGLYNFWGSSPYGDGKVKMDEKAISFIDDAITKKEAIAMSGFIAQEVEKAAQECNYVFDGVSPPQNDKDHYRIAYAEFVVPLVKAVQEQQRMIENQNKIINKFSETINEQNNIISDLIKRITSLEKKN